MARALKTPARGLRFTEGNHTYYLDGKRCPGVTTILKVLDKPALTRWAATTVAEYVADHPDAIEVLRDAGRPALVTTLKEVPFQKRDKAAERGKNLHDYTQQLLEGVEIDVDTVPDELIPVLENAIAFLDDWQIVPLLIEAPVASRADWWAGTLDLVAGYTRPDTGATGVGVFDWKSGKGIYAEYAWQFSAYGHAEFSGLLGDETPLPEGIASAFGVQIRADGYDVAPMAYSRAIYDEFLAIKAVAEIATRGRGDYKRPGSGHVGIMIQTGIEVTR